MKSIPSEILLFLFFSAIFGCKDNNSFDFFMKYKKPEINIKDIISEKNIAGNHYKNNLINMKNGLPFYIIRMEAPLLLKKPSTNYTIPDEFVALNFGDIVFPLKDYKPVKYYFLVKTIDGTVGWIYNGSGISLNYNEDPNLYFFSEQYYLKRYIDADGNIGNSNKGILIKNVVPMLLENFTTNGWFYPPDYELALKISKYAESIAEHKNTFFYSASSLYDWRIHEVVVSKNLLADSYQKLRFYNEAEEIQKYILRWYFWMRADNSPIGGLNSIVKLEKIYLEMLSKEEPGSRKYYELQEKIIETLLIIGDKYNKFTIIDPKWHLTGAEWVINILLNSLKREEFYDIAKKLARRTASDGYAEMVNIYIAIEMYREGRRTEALKILTSVKPKKNFKSTLRINDWLSANKIIPDSIIYQYKF